MRRDGRLTDELRPISLEIDYLKAPMGSALIRCGQTWVLCTASVEEQQPAFLRAQKSSSGWVTAEYAMLPGSTTTRSSRGPSGRGKEIERLIGRSLRAAVNLEALGPRTVTVDCDVLQADGGTRTAAITGGYVALALCLSRLVSRGLCPGLPVRQAVAAISVGIVDGQVCLDLPYEEDARAAVDMNIVMAQTFGEPGDTGRAEPSFVEVQGTGEHGTFSRAQLDELLEVAARGMRRLFALQNSVLAGASLIPPSERG